MMITEREIDEIRARQKARAQAATAIERAITKPLREDVDILLQYIAQLEQKLDIGAHCGVWIGGLG